MTDSLMPKEAKSPLHSKQLTLGALTLIAGLIAKANPEAGEFIRANADTILSVVGGLSMLFRGVTTKPIEWTFFGIGKKF